MNLRAVGFAAACLACPAVPAEEARRLILPAPGELPAGIVAPSGGDDDVVELPPLVVSPGELERWYVDRSLQRYRETLPSLGTDLARKKDVSEKILEMLGLTGEGVQGLHPADQRELSNFVEKLDGQLE